jgi:hypothetical protein
MMTLMQRVRRSALAGAIGVAGLIAVAATVRAQAVDIEALAQRAIEASRAGKPLEALRALDEAAIAAWLKTPLGFRTAIFVKDQARSYGLYEAADPNALSSAAPLHIYAEPIGYGWRQDGDLFVIGVAFDIVLKDKSGRTLLERKGFLQSNVQGRSRNREFFASIRLNMTGAPAGDYVVTITANDPVTGKSGSFTLPFKLGS